MDTSAAEGDGFGAEDATTDGALGTVLAGGAGAAEGALLVEPDGFGPQPERTAASPNRGNQRGGKKRFIMRSAKFTEAVGQFGFRI